MRGSQPRQEVAATTIALIVPATVSPDPSPSPPDLVSRSLAVGCTLDYAVTCSLGDADPHAHTGSVGYADPHAVTHLKANSEANRERHAVADEAPRADGWYLVRHPDTRGPARADPDGALGRAV